MHIIKINFFALLIVIAGFIISFTARSETYRYIDISGSEFPNTGLLSVNKGDIIGDGVFTFAVEDLLAFTFHIPALNYTFDLSDPAIEKVCIDINNVGYFACNGTKQYGIASNIEAIDGVINFIYDANFGNIEEPIEEPRPRSFSVEFENYHQRGNIDEFSLEMLFPIDYPNLDYLDYSFGEVRNNKGKVIGIIRGIRRRMDGNWVFAGISPPTAAFGFDPQAPKVNDIITFDGSPSHDDGQILIYIWDFGDGSTGEGITTSHSYTRPGEYDVTLTVIDNNGLSDTNSKSISTLCNTDPSNVIPYIPSPLPPMVSCGVADLNNDRMIDEDEEDIFLTTSCIRTDRLPGTEGLGREGLSCLLQESVKDSRGVSFEQWCTTFRETETGLTCPRCFGFYIRDDNLPDNEQLTLVGKCWFFEGQNNFLLEQTRDIDPDTGAPSCFVSSVWQNSQVHRNEPDAPLPNDLSGTRLPQDGKLDTWRWTHHVFTRKTDIEVLKDGETVFYEDPLSGPLFNDLPPIIFEALPENLGIMTSETLIGKCDLNGDEKCNNEDLDIINSSIGSCRDETYYNPLHDADTDGCITESDKLILFNKIPGDFDGDRDIDYDDYNIFINTFGLCEGQEGYNSDANFDDSDSCITFVDYQHWYALFYSNK